MTITLARANAKSGIATQSSQGPEGVRDWCFHHLLWCRCERDTPSSCPVHRPWPALQEGIHAANERRLGEIIGKNVTGKLHTGLSRNKQVVCDKRMWHRDDFRKIDEYLVSFLKLVAARAETEILQRAQSIRKRHWMFSYGLAFASDL
ncbi:hypothetical protein FDECE_6348 [Fusarium decemcellulare]|nr:hypothetical protein FDECE_6348 [Fusarium decemcellulare]